MSWCKCPGVPRGQTPGMAADKCIISCMSQCRSHSACSDVQCKAEVFVLSKSFLIVIFYFNFIKRKYQFRLSIVISINGTFFIEYFSTVLIVFT